MEYQARVQKKNFCWDKSKQNFVVERKPITGILFVQTGFEVQY